jgi:hypothetical protein
MARIAQILTILLVAACTRSQPTVRPESPDADVSDALKEHPEVRARSRAAVHDEIRRSRLDEWQRFQKTVSAFSAADGISREEAEFLGWAYFTWDNPFCGHLGPARLAKREWLMSVTMGLTGKPELEDIRIDKRTGAVRSGSERPISARRLIEIERKRLLHELEASEEDSSGT